MIFAQTAQASAGRSAHVIGCRPGNCLIKLLARRPTKHWPMDKTKILIDCDPGHDDALAILYAARHLELVGVTTVHGNNTLENTTRNALSVLELGGLTQPVAAGCASPLAQPRHPSAAAHGHSGLDGADLPRPSRDRVNTHAVDFIIESASQHRGELVLAILGPQTNVAVALQREPCLVDWIKEATIMGGSTDRGNVTPAAEFNVHCDPEAAWAVLNSGMRTRWVGFNVTRTTGFNEGDLRRLRESGGQVATTMADLMGFYLARQQERRRTEVAPVHDVCAIVPHVDESLLTYVGARMTVELTGTHTRGMTVCHLDEGLGLPTAAKDWPLVRVATAARSSALVEQLLQTLASYDR